MARWTLPLDDRRIDLTTGGGKAVNLRILANARLAVPAGFLVTTEAYRGHVERHALDRLVRDTLRELQWADPAALQAASTRLREAFRRGTVDLEVAEEVRAGYLWIGAGAVAVRSSATAEDLPDASFAGQQDTFLNVQGSGSVIDAIRDCWSSLWTARAMAYRQRNGIDHHGAAVGVVVQRMVPAEVSGVLFTANPLTGHRGQMVADATFGLGEALVSGQVQPDHYLLEHASGAVLDRTLGSKAVATVSDSSGGVHLQDRVGDDQPTLTDAQASALAALGRQIETLYAAPQDIEWAWHDGAFHILQTRAITSLFPIPEGAPPDSVWLSFGAVQGMLDPITPLGRDALRCILSGGASLFGHSVWYGDNPVLGVAAERLWIRIDRAVRHPVGSRVIPTFLDFIDPSARSIIDGLRDEGGLDPLTGAPAHRSMARFGRALAHFAPRALPHLPGVFARPEHGRDQFDAAIEELLGSVRERVERTAGEPDPIKRISARARALGAALSQAFPAVAPYAAPMVAPAVAALRMLSRLTDSTGVGHGVSPTVMQITRSVPRNPTTEMDLDLWAVAERIRSDTSTRQWFATQDGAGAAVALANGTMPPLARGAVTDFLARWGMRGVGEIDLGRPRWRDDPTDLLGTVVAYVQLPEEFSPRRAFAQGETAAEQAIAELTEKASSMSRGPARAGAVALLSRRVRALAGAREQPKFTVIQVMGICRDALLASGADLVELGVLERAEDIMFLQLQELLTLPGSELSRLAPLTAARRAAYDKERRRPRVPRVLVGDGRAYYEGLSAGPGDILGSPVSPGAAEGLVRVVHEPARAELQPGEILVCRGTDPAWTPLFLTAAGLVTEVGGMMTHGSVVAREYGIPGVVGVHDATTRLRTGDRIRIDGSTGVIQLLTST